MATIVSPRSSPSPAGRRRLWRLGGAVIIGGVSLLGIALVASYFSEEQKALRAIQAVGGTTEADTMEEGPVTVRTVNLRGPTITDAEVEQVAPHLPHLPELFTLDVSMARVTDRGLARLRGLTHLGDLILRYTRVSDAGLEHLQGWDNLRTLDLMHTRVTDRGLETVSKNHPGLRTLDLDETRITDQGLTYVKTLRRLEWLALARTAVTAAGLRRLANLKHLRTLAVGRTRVTDHGVEQLRAALPNLRVER